MIATTGSAEFASAIAAGSSLKGKEQEVISSTIITERMNGRISFVILISFPIYRGSNKHAAGQILLQALDGMSIALMKWQSPLFGREKSWLLSSDFAKTINEFIE
jgi:hypothetical protein